MWSLSFAAVCKLSNKQTIKVYITLKWNIWVYFLKKILIFSLIKMLKVWHMLNDDDIVSQFDANYHGDYNLDLLANKIGVNHYKVIKIFNF